MKNSFKKPQDSLFSKSVQTLFIKSKPYHLPSLTLSLLITPLLFTSTTSANPSTPLHHQTPDEINLEINKDNNAPPITPLQAYHILDKTFLYQQGLGNNHFQRWLNDTIGMQASLCASSVLNAKDIQEYYKRNKGQSRIVKNPSGVFTLANTNVENQICQNLDKQRISPACSFDKAWAEPDKRKTLLHSHQLSLPIDYVVNDKNNTNVQIVLSCWLEKSQLSRQSYFPPVTTFNIKTSQKNITTPTGELKLNMGSQLYKNNQVPGVDGKEFFASFTAVILK